MKPGGSIRKGNKFENDVAKLILQAAGKGFKREDCYRTPISGGHFAASKEDPGDLVLSDRLLAYFPFVLECKNQQVLDFEHFFFMPKPMKAWKEQKWLLQVMKSALSIKKRIPMLVVTKKNSGAYAIVPVLDLYAWSDVVSKGFPTGEMKFIFGGTIWIMVPLSRVLKALSEKTQGKAKAKEQRKRRK